MIRLGLCCVFKREPIRFRRTTFKNIAARSRSDQLRVISDICLHNARSLMKALEFCRDNRIGDFRINSQILPLYTHPEAGYRLQELPDGGEITNLFDACRLFGIECDLRMTLHPDQFILLSSVSEEVTKRSLEELDYQAVVAEMIGADVINIHGGGAYGNKADALERVVHRVENLPDAVRSRLTFENDDRVYTPQDLLPICERTKVPFVYDVHHHRCFPDDMSEEQATTRCIATWNREPLFHISSPKDGWGGSQPCRHHDFIQPDDFPDIWLNIPRDITIEVEAKAKELAVLRLHEHIASSGHS